MSTKLKLKEKGRAIEQANRKMLGIAAKDAQLHFSRSFYDEGFTDEVLNKWQPRKRKIRSVGSLALGKRTLTKSGALRRSIRFYVSSTKASISSDLPYAAIHNEGLIGRAWGKYPFRMPKRKFLGNSKQLERRTLAKWTAQIKTALRNA